MKQTMKWALPLLAIALAGCNSSSDDKDSNSGSDPDQSQFTQTATWTFLPSTTSATTECFDFDSNSVVNCDTTSTWDLKVVHASGASGTPQLFTNSGVSGEGNAAALGSPFDYSWTELQAFTSGTVDGEGATLPSQAFYADTVSNAFKDSVFSYNGTTHKMAPTYRVFVVTTDASQTLPDIKTANAPGTAFAIQAIDYYGGDSGSTSGYVSIRWVDVTDTANVQTATINATSYTDWVYFDLVNGAVVTDPVNNPWEIAFQRYDVKTNSGISGTGTAGTFKGSLPAAGADATAAETVLKDGSTNWGWVTTPRPSSWSYDIASSSLNPAYQGSYPGLLSYGLYSYDPTGSTAGTAHMLVANPDNGVMLRSGEGNSYARMHLTSISYADPDSASSQRTYTFEFEVAPAQ